MHTQENQSVTWNYMVDVLSGAVSAAQNSSFHPDNNDASCFYTEVFFLPNNFITGHHRYAQKSSSEGLENPKI